MPYYLAGELAEEPAKADGLGNDGHLPRFFSEERNSGKRLKNVPGGNLRPALRFIWAAVTAAACPLPCCEDMGFFIIKKICFIYRVLKYYWHAQRQRWTKFGRKNK